MRHRSRFMPPILAGLACLALAACGDLIIPLPSGRQPGTFWTHNMVTKSPYTVDAALLVEGKYCTVWADKASGVSLETAAGIARVYDERIYPEMMATFGMYGLFRDDSGAVVARNTMEFADWLGDGDGKLCILLLDIQDGYSVPGNLNYVAGYFSPNNFFANNISNPHSNAIDMIYIDTWPGKPGSEESNVTLVHEMQHLMNFATSMVRRQKDKSVALMDLWIDEGLSSAAEYAYLAPRHNLPRLDWFNKDPSGLIARGNNFFVWGNHGENPNAILDDYATVYLFFQWLRIQAGGTSIYGEIMTSGYSDFRAVTEALSAPTRDWEGLLGSWLAANYDPLGPDAYQGDASLAGGIRHTPAPGDETIKLGPGEAAYFPLAAGGADTPGGNVRYRTLPAADSGIAYTSGTEGPAPGQGAVLAYNVNTDARGPSEEARITRTDAQGAPKPTGKPRASLSAPAATGTAPRPIDARDALRRAGHSGGLPGVGPVPGGNFRVEEPGEE